jgi:hypothetical protein
MKPPPKLTFRQKLWPPIEPVVLILLRDIILFFIVLAALLVGFAGIAGLKAFGMPEDRLQILETAHFWAYTTVEIMFLLDMVLKTFLQIFIKRHG